MTTPAADTARAPGRRGSAAAWTSGVVFFGGLAAANALRISAGGPAGDLEYLEALAFGVAFFIVWVAAFGRLWPAVLCAFACFAWWWPAELYLRHEYSTPVAPQFVGMALESNGGELGEFAATFARELIGGVLFLAAISLPALVLARRHRVKWRGRSRWWCLVAFPLAAFAMYELFQLQEPAWLKPTEDPFRVEPLAFWTDKWRSVYPLTLPLALVQVRDDAQRVAQMRAHVAGFRFGAAKAEAPLDTVLLVIGESSRADRWSLNGYARATNPRLATRKNLVFLSNVVSPSVATRFAVPFIVSRRPVLLADGKPNPRPEPSLIAAFKEAGYRTAWLSSQSSSGFWDTTTAFYARDAQVAKFINPAGPEHRGTHDEALVEPLAAILAAPGAQMVVVHTMGSHFNYANRYPGAFDRFQPSLGRAAELDPTPGKQATEIANSYDNTILYTDHVLDRLIAQVEQRGGRSVVAYVSDHGEDLADAACPGIGVRRDGRWSYRVPAFVWVSDALARAKPGLLARLRERSGEALQTDAILPTLLEMAAVRIPDDADAGTAGLLSPAPPARARMVVGQGGGWTDFDAAERRDPCHIRQR